MKGLLIKDFQLIFLNIRMLVALCIVSIFLTSSSTSSAAFVISYITIVFFMFVLTTISYDELDHSISFLFTLPVSRKTYVLEKYVFSLICGMVGLIFSTVICTVIGMIKNINFIGPDFIPVALTIYLMLLFIVAFMLPIQLKFGGDNGRIAIFLIFGIIVAAVYIGNKVLEHFHIYKADIIKFVQSLFTANTALIIPAFIILVLATLGISYGISLRIMERRTL